jgi:hypothetical protein
MLATMVQGDAVTMSRRSRGRSHDVVDDIARDVAGRVVDDVSGDGTHKMASSAPAEPSTSRGVARRRPNKGPMEYLVPASLLAMSANRDDVAAGDATTSPLEKDDAAGGDGMAMSELQIEIAELRDELTRALVAAATAGGAVTGLREALGRADAELAALRADLAEARRELAEARKGWLERVLEAIKRTR